ncbi:ead/Ea22-like family protein [Enterobacter bugandensis]|uniref:ead/Ea22-like family protein n=1 Tax=Enterobacter bugandensis TaxID=881260 RepID=UPI000F827D9C|nr:ead/Ea22-like family protein [Enterobacter bugandensis]RTM20145.1 hypothetical protein EKO15_13225 [Enterobacter bugandensis]
MSNIDKHALRKLAVDAKELAIIKRYTKGIEAQKKFIAEMTPATVLALLDELEAKDKLNAELMEKQRLIDICQGQGLEHRIAAEKRAEAAEKRIAELEVVKELLLRAKALMYQSGGTPIENSLNPIDAWLYDAERAAAACKGE